MSPTPRIKAAARAALPALLLATAVHAAEVPLGDDGLHKPGWLMDTFKDLPEDAAEARAEGRRLVILVEQRGCIYCAEMHESTFTDPRVREMLEDDFFPVQMNLHGDIEIVDTDGEALSEKAAARKWGVMFTPSMIFLPDEPADDASAAQQAVAILPGAFGPGTTLDMLTWVKERLYDSDDPDQAEFQRFHAAQIRARGDGDTR